jgi:hypothetical protein
MFGKSAFYIKVAFATPSFHAPNSSKETHPHLMDAFILSQLGNLPHHIFTGNINIVKGYT